MNRQEFVKEVFDYASSYDKVKLAEMLTRTEYELIEFVYNFHPCIDNVSGKKQVAMLFVEFGFRIFVDMKSTAIRACEIEEELSKARQSVSCLEAEYDELKNLRVWE